MADDQQLELLQGIARALGVTPTGAVSRVTVGRVYFAFMKTWPLGRARQLVRALLRAFVVRFWRTPVDELTVARWDEHMVKRRREPTRMYRGTRRFELRRAPPAAATLNLERMRVLQMLNWALDAEMIRRNPIARCKRLKKARKGRDTRLTREQFDTLIAHAHVLGPRDHRPEKFRALCLALCDGMMRIGAARRIRRDRIGLDGKYVIPASQSKNGAAHLVEFTDECLAAFAAVPPYPGSPFVLSSPRRRGAAYDATTLRLWFYEVGEACGINAAAADGDFKVKPHDLRATGASIAEENGATVRQIQLALNHAQPETTLRYLRRAKNVDAHSMRLVMERRRGPQRVAQENERGDTLVSKKILSSSAGSVS